MNNRPWPARTMEPGEESGGPGPPRPGAGLEGAISQASMKILQVVDGLWLAN